MPSDAFVCYPIRQRPELGKFWWCAASVNGQKVWSVLDTASHDMLVPHADKCTKCTERKTTPRGVQDLPRNAKKSAMHFSIESVHMSRGKGEVCAIGPDGDAQCDRRPVLWITSADRLGYAVRGVGPGASAHTVLGVGIPADGHRGRMWTTPHPGVAQHAATRSTPLYVQDTVVKGPQAHKLPCVNVQRVQRPGNAGDGVATSGNTAVMLDTGTPGCILPGEWLGKSTKGVTSPQYVARNVTLHLENGVTLTGVSVYNGGSLASIQARFGCDGIIGSESMRGWAVEMHYKDRKVLFTPLA
uniref:Uncharacterized protein n=1 Tax=viral metagenome TaxID=1070528 RepID=A0A6C0AUR4_9ZZZZ